MLGFIARPSSTNSLPRSENGFTIPVLADEKGLLLPSDPRICAAAKLGLAEVPVIVARGWSDEEKQAYRVADKQLAARASSDFELLRSELRALEFTGFDLDLIGFDSDEFATFLAGLGTSGLTDPDSVPEVPDQPVTRRGDVWQLGDHRVGCGDSTSAADVAAVLAGSERHLMATDPPYGVEYGPSWRGRRNQSGGKLACSKVLNDDRADWREAYTLFPGDVAYVWHGALHGDIVVANLAACGLQLRVQIVWAKQHFTLSRGHYHWKHECCSYAVRDGKTSHWQGDRTQTTLWEIANNQSFRWPAVRAELGAPHPEAGRMHAPPDCQQQPARPGDLRPVSWLRDKPDRRRNDRPHLLRHRAQPGLCRCRRKALAALHRAPRDPSVLRTISRRARRRPGPRSIRIRT